MMRVILVIYELCCYVVLIRTHPAFDPAPDWSPYVIEKYSDKKLQCLVKREKEFKVEWLKDGNPIDANNKTTKITNHGQELVIYDSQLSDAGFYTCLVSYQSSATDVVNFTAFIDVYTRNVNAAPRITNLSPNEITEVKLGQSINISCTINSGINLDGTSSYWVRNGLELLDNPGKFNNLPVESRRNDGETDRIHTLTIENITVEDFGKYICYTSNGFGHDNRTLTMKLYHSPKRTISRTIVIGISCGGGALVFILVVSSIAAYRRKKKLETLDPWFDVSNYEEYDGEIEHDVFISYSSADMDWVRHELFEGLSSRGYRVCVDFKDFMLGGTISNNILDSINKSHHTLVVMSKNFLKSGWGIFELEHAHYKFVTERKDILLFVKLDDCKIPSKLLGKTYLDWFDENVRPNFWQRLSDALGKPGIFKIPIENTFCSIGSDISHHNIRSECVVIRNPPCFIPKSHRRSDEEELMGWT